MPKMKFTLPVTGILGYKQSLGTLTSNYYNAAFSNYSVYRSWFGTKVLLDFKNHCTLCMKHRNNVKNLIGVPKSFICNECVDLLNEIIIEQDCEKVNK